MANDKFVPLSKRDFTEDQRKWIFTQDPYEISREMCAILDEEIVREIVRAAKREDLNEEIE